MSDDAFASSHAPRRYSTLTDAEYARMHDALTESARGRWFLDEYTRRNRNADTAMVLDAVARIENVVAAQQAPNVASPADLRNELRQVVQTARAAIGSLAAGEAEDALGPARRGTRIIREIAWQMRACGNDPRICNILDAQLDAIDGALVAPSGECEGQLRAALDQIIAQLSELAGETSDATGKAPAEAIAEHHADEDDTVLERIAAEMATPDSGPDIEHPDEASSAPIVPLEAPKRRGSLGEMLIARGIIKPREERDPAHAPEGAHSA